ncbi:MAG: hypothetical protein K0Q73_5375 [Paenibacillus sp.]|jgi:hypothetical protein|nr:hypothetical protein [Paenibacillus sp.]
MSVRAKFFVSEKATTAYNGSGDAAVLASRIILSPVLGGGSDENKKFFKATPSGKIELQIVNQDAGEALEIGKEYFVDFTPAE